MAAARWSKPDRLGVQRTTVIDRDGESVPVIKTSVEYTKPVFWVISEAYTGPRRGNRPATHVRYFRESWHPKKGVFAYVKIIRTRSSVRDTPLLAT